MVPFHHAPFSYLFLLVIPSSLSFYLPDSNPLLSFDNQVREVHLYTDNHRRGLYLQMTQDGGVAGSDVQTPHSVLQLKSVKPGQVAIWGTSSSLYLCVDSRGSLRGQATYAEDDCSFQELLLADGYTRFVSSHYGFPVSLASRQSPGRHAVPFTRFLPIRNSLTSRWEEPQGSQTHVDTDSGDLLGMGLNSMVSPQFLADK